MILTILGKNATNVEHMLWCHAMDVKFANGADLLALANWP
jgi:hypothetical protein